MITHQSQVTHLNIEALSLVNHNMMIGIVNEIIQGLDDVQESPPSLQMISNKRAAWTNGIRLTPEAKLAAFNNQSGGNKHLMTFRMDMSISDLCWLSRWKEKEKRRDRRS
jgi:hypothetical protein